MTNFDFPHLPRRAFLQLLAAAGASSVSACSSMGLEGMWDGGESTAADRKLATFFAESFKAEVARSPEFLTYMGSKERYGEWDDRSDAAVKAAHEQTVADLAALPQVADRAQLSEGMRVSYDVFKFRGEQRVAAHPFRFHDYSISHFYGPHQSVPATLITQHRIDDVADAEAYISRLNGTGAVFDQSIEFLRAQEAIGVTLPKFSYALIIADAREVPKGAPFAGDGENSIAGDFGAKVEKLDISADAKTTLIEKAQAALLDVVGPAYERFIAALQDIGGKVKTDHGVGTLPDGAAFYDERIRFHTTLPLTADEIHALGLKDVARLNKEMGELKTQAKFSGSLKAFYADLRTNKAYYYENNDAGRRAYMERSAELLAGAKAALRVAFGILPKADIGVKRIEPYREKGQTIAFYDASTADGSRPANVYLNLADMSKMPKWQMAPLIFHEGIPGHHLQIAIAQEAEATPDFRKYVSFTAFIEGWGLYSEQLADEMGLYKDVFDQIGRVAMEQWRACRLVVDTGIHVKGWSRQKAIDYYLANTPLTDDNIRREINRYFVYPGQACAYQVGKNKIVELRESAKERLRQRYDMRGFHDVVLKNGAVPLSVLETVVAEWEPAEMKPET